MAMRRASILTAIAAVMFLHVTRAAADWGCAASLAPNCACHDADPCDAECCDGWLLGRRRRGPAFEGLDPHFNCGCNGSYKFPVPPLSTYHWPGMWQQNLMTDYHSPWRFPPLKPYRDEDSDNRETVEPASFIGEPSAARERFSFGSRLEAMTR
jgi:hypothetical protein